MLQYLINATAIWLISLVMFDVFLRKESYHSYNRFYLLATFLAGALLPLWQWQGTVNNRGITAASPLQKVIVAKTTIANAATTNSSEFDFQFWLIGIYLLGVTVALVIIAMGSVKLLGYYRAGNKSFIDGWTVIETNKEHAPFSFRKMLFVSGIDCYTDEEWTMITTHEARHTALRHLIDVLLMQLARIVFWFHPLVYLYNKRLLMVHEYQADSAGTTHHKEYGSFLIEQSIFQPAPLLSHSFNRSPIKNRIVMLTHTSSKAARTKMLIFIPIAIVAFFCFTKTALSQKMVRNGNIVTFKGNTIVYEEKRAVDTIIMTDPVTGNNIVRYISKDPLPLTFNGKKIANPSDLSSEPSFANKNQTIRKYLIEKIKPVLNKLDDGSYRFDITTLIVNESGTVVYYEYGGFNKNNSSSEVDSPIPASITGAVSKFEYRDSTKNANSTRVDSPIPASIQEEIESQIAKAFDNFPKMKPATSMGKKVMAIFMDHSMWDAIEIKDHKIINQY